MNQRSLADLKIGESAKIVSMHGGKYFAQKAESLGIRIGSKVKKMSAQVMAGPITIKVGQTTIALGHRMAKRIYVE